MVDIIQKLNNLPNNIPDKSVSWKIHASTINELKKLKHTLNLPSYEAVVKFLIHTTNHDANYETVSYDKIFNQLQTRPVVITGPSGSGKTTTIKELLSNWHGSLLVIDVHSEYQDLKTTDFAQFYKLDFLKSRSRFIPDNNTIIASSQCSAIFQHLMQVMHSGKLKQTCIVIEEAHRFSTDANLRALITESRKFVRKLIVVCSDASLYAPLAPVLYPAKITQLCNGRGDGNASY